MSFSSVNTVFIVGKGFYAYRGYILEELHEAGVEVWLADDDPVVGSEAKVIARNFEVNFEASPRSEAERLKSSSDEWENLTGVCYIESLLPWAAEFFEYLQVSFLSPAEAVLLRSKSKQREAFGLAGLPSPAHVSGTPAELQSQSLNFPLVIKPESGYSSIGVELIRSDIELAEYFSRENNVHSDDFVVEEVISGVEYSLEGYARGGKSFVLAKTTKFKTPLPFFEEVGQFCARDILPETQEREFFSRGVDALGISDSVFHFEFFDSQQSLIPVEVGGRLGGDKIPYLQRRVTGRSLLLEYLDISHDFGQSKTQGIGVVFFVPAEAGVVSDSFPTEALLAQLDEHFLETTAGKKVPVAPDDFFVRLGFSVVEADTVADFVRIGNDRIGLFEQNSGVKLHRLRVSG